MNQFVQVTLLDTLLLFHVFTHFFLFPSCLQTLSPLSSFCLHSPLSHSQVETLVLHLRSHFPSPFSSVQTRPMLSTLITRKHVTLWSYKSLAAANIGHKEEGQGKVNRSFPLLSNMVLPRRNVPWMTLHMLSISMVTNVIPNGTIYSSLYLKLQ